MSGLIRLTRHIILLALQWVLLYMLLASGIISIGSNSTVCKLLTINCIASAADKGYA